MKVTKLMHVCIVVPNLERALNFYCDVLGFRSDFETDNDKADGRLLGFDEDEIHLKAQHLISESTDPSEATEINVVEYTDPKTLLSSQPYTQQNNIGITRLALEVNDVDEALDDIRSVEGVEVVCEPKNILIVEPAVTVTARWCSFKDPFGIFITLSQPPMTK
ncbi:VOC family protein [Secundilactobacillus folii]|uniref:VOC family protein n=1 Tax=Secundilactobacillus folii TaxID=2678357 RepID=A0A7X2XYP3_9LACO|nr:VOC family protein [Secundilactobacillus folii]MTV82761.1 VOC family protein [Secundilactobacillus folii]